MNARAVALTLLFGTSGCSVLYGGGLVAEDDQQDAATTDAAVADSATGSPDTSFDSLPDGKAAWFCTAGCDVSSNRCCWRKLGNVCSPTKCVDDDGLQFEALCESKLDCPGAFVCCVTELWPDSLKPKKSDCAPSCGGDFWTLCNNGGPCPTARPYCIRDGGFIKDAPFGLDRCSEAPDG